MAGTLITITDAGRTALVAPGNAGTNRHEIVKIGLCNAAFAADKALTKLPGELKRITTFAGENVARDTIHVTLRDDTPDQYTLYGFGLYLENDVLFAVYSQATPIMEKSPAAMVLLSSDIQFTTIDAAQLVFGDASFTNPSATTERQGVVELATQPETDAGDDDTRAITPKTAAKRYAALTGASFTGPIDAGAGAIKGTVRSDNASAFYYASGSGNAFLGGLSTGWTSLVTNNIERVRVTASGRVLIGTLNDDGSNLVQAAGNARIDGNLSVRRTGGEGQIYVGQNDGYFYANTKQVGWYSPTLGQFQYDFTAKNLYVGNNPVWHAGNLPNPLDKSGGTMGGQLLVAEGTVNTPGLSFANDGMPDTGFWHISDGTFGVTCNGVEQARFSPDGANFRARPTWAGFTPWDSGNFNPANYATTGDRDWTDSNKVSKSGDTMTGRLTLSQPNLYGELGLRSTDGSMQYMRGRSSGGGMEWVNHAYNSVVANTDDAGSFWLQNVCARGVLQAAGRVYSGNGSGSLCEDGNIQGGIWGGYLSNWLNSQLGAKQNTFNHVWGRDGGNGRYSFSWDGRARIWVDGQHMGAIWTDSNFDPGSKANAGAQCQKSDRAHYFGTVNGQVHLPDPWCIDGLEDPMNAKFGEIRIYGCWYRNQ
jgi:hypothetical protein